MLNNSMLKVKKGIIQENYIGKIDNKVYFNTIYIKQCEFIPRRKARTES